jgi:uncharacterized protein
MSSSSNLGTALITGASSGIGELYADRLANRGHDLILVARRKDRLDAIATRLSRETGNHVETVVADLANPADLAHVESVLRDNKSITTLVNNAGLGGPGTLLDSDVDSMMHLITLNVTALMRLTYAAVPGFVARGRGTIINIASIVAIGPEILNGVYGGSKAFVLAFSQSLRHELSDKKVRVQVVAPGATETDFWEKGGVPVQHLPKEIVMRADEMVDAALAGLDQGEFVTIPSLPNAADWDAYEAARQKLMPNLSHHTSAARYGVAAKQTAYTEQPFARLIGHP